MLGTIGRAESGRARTVRTRAPTTDARRERRAWRSSFFSAKGSVSACALFESVWVLVLRARARTRVVVRGIVLGTPAVSPLVRACGGRAVACGAGPTRP